jgi:hypothetical protein
MLQDHTYSTYALNIMALYLPMYRHQYNTGTGRCRVSLYHFQCSIFAFYYQLMVLVLAVVVVVAAVTVVVVVVVLVAVSSSNSSRRRYPASNYPLYIIEEKNYY